MFSYGSEGRGFKSFLVQTGTKPVNSTFVDGTGFFFYNSHLILLWRWLMGMTNEQFDSYKTRILRDLERTKDEYDKDGKSRTLEILMDDLKSELKKP
jgi:hypothetical protein